MNKLAAMLDAFEGQPVIAAVRDDKGLALALESPVAAVFLVNATLKNLRGRIQQIRKSNKAAFVHLEMVAGLSKDIAALEFLKEECDPDGIIITKPNLVQPARNLGMLTIQRLFMLDSMSVQTGLKMMHGNPPDFMEIMPGIIPKVITEMKGHSKTPIIAGGMVSTKEEIIEQLKAGAVAVSTGREALWSV